jgi:hypothetical protein
MSAVLACTWQDVARQVWPGATWVLGEGQFATIRGCGGKTTVLLHPTVEEARAALRRMHPGGTHGQCAQPHVLIELGVPRE